MTDSEHSYPGIPTHELRRIAVAAVCDPRTVVKYLRNKPIVDSGRIRIEQALRSLGRIDLVRQAAGAVAELASGAK